jgi:diadenosine tetraphosphate (Ap4A) HIT family hydrolase
MNVAECVLDPRLAAESIFVLDWNLSRVLLMNDRRFPWLVLVPRRKDAIELFDLAEPDRVLLAGEIARAAEGLKKLSGADKINIGMLGNIVPQLHVHVVARKQGDLAWPGPVWGRGPAESYEKEAIGPLLTKIVTML